MEEKKEINIVEYVRSELELNKYRELRNGLVGYRTNSKIREEWDKAEKNSDMILPGQISEGGVEQTAVSMGLIRGAENTGVETITNQIFKAKKAYALGGVGKEDVLWVKTMDRLLNFRFRRMLDCRWNIMQVLQNMFEYGVGVGKCQIKDEKLYIEGLNSKDISWSGNSFNGLNAIYHSVERTEQELRAVKTYEGVDEYINKIKGIEQKDEVLKNKVIKKYSIGELWYLKDDKWRVATFGEEERKAGMLSDIIAKFRDIETPYKFRHPFLMGFDWIKINEFNGYGESELLKNHEYATNMLVNLGLSYMQLNLKPPFLYTDDLLNDTVADLERLERPELGGGIHVGDISNAMKYLFPPQIDMSSSFGLTSFIKNTANDLTGNPEILSGGGVPSREPNATTSGRWDKASGKMNFRSDNFFDFFMKPLAINLLTWEFQNISNTKGSIIRILGGEYAKVELQGGDENKVITPSQQTEKKDTLTIVLNTKVEDIKEMFDIEIKPYISEDINKISDFLKNFPQLLAMLPMLQAKVNDMGILNLFLNVYGIEYENLELSEQEQAEKLKMLQSMQGGQNGKAGLPM